MTRLRKVSTTVGSRGLGDTLEKAISKATFGKVKSCGKCKKRRDKLNQMFPYKKNPKE
tara:strand:- start:257 stop:430 length:174 start_codon:yes stop_codon:yes gene_type:complete